MYWHRTPYVFTQFFFAVTMGRGNLVSKSESLWMQESNTWNIERNSAAKGLSPFHAVFLSEAIELNIFSFSWKCNSCSLDFGCFYPRGSDSDHLRCRVLHRDQESEKSSNGPFQEHFRGWTFYSMLSHDYSRRVPSRSTVFRDVSSGSLQPIFFETEKCPAHMARSALAFGRKSYWKSCCRSS